MIILNEEQKNLVKGLYGRFKELNPIQIKDGSYMLPEIILEEQVFSSVFDVLNTCTKRDVSINEFIVNDI